MKTIEEMKWGPRDEMNSRERTQRTQRIKTKTDFKQEVTEAAEISVASLNSCSKFLYLGNPGQNELNVVAVVQRTKAGFLRDHLGEGTWK
jgi:6-phosphogluconolactonase (cycloisomerase 2 family)